MYIFVFKKGMGMRSSEAQAKSSRELAEAEVLAAHFGRECIFRVT
jgi:hypothetical protein